MRERNEKQKEGKTKRRKERKKDRKKKELRKDKRVMHAYCTSERTNGKEEVKTLFLLWRVKFLHVIPRSKGLAAAAAAAASETIHAAIAMIGTYVVCTQNRSSSQLQQQYNNKLSFGNVKKGIMHQSSHSSYSNVHIRQSSAQAKEGDPGKSESQAVAIYCPISYS